MMMRLCWEDWKVGGGGSGKGMTEILDLFPKTYEASRQRFRETLGVVQAMWPEARLVTEQVEWEGDLTTDWIEGQALERNEKVLVLTTGEHGIEGYVGSAMLQRFTEVFLPRLDPQTTGILLLHAINPWGMKHRRRTNAHNVDLNRNFVWQAVEIDAGFNPEALKIEGLVNPPKKAGSHGSSKLGFMLRLPRILRAMGHAGFKWAVLLGNYRNPKGIFYGGEGYQQETCRLMALYQDRFADYEQILHLDMHTGYGPRYQMSLVNSGYEKGNSREFEKRFGYPLVVAANSDEFYELRGDMIDYVYCLWRERFPEKRLYANSFEFGTYGDSKLAFLRTIRAMTLENQAYWFGGGSPQAEARIRDDFLELFYPQAADWQRKAVADGDRAFEGILKAEGYIAG